MANNSSVYIILLILLASILFALFQNNIKGVIGEKTVASILCLLSSYKYKVINNVVLNINGKTSQIDHIVISDSGIFVIETKNYKGWIMGGENSEYWTQVLYKRKEKFYNPIRQNYGHIHALKNCLYEYSNIRYISIIVFSSKAKIKVNTNTVVTYPFNLLAVLRNYSEINLSENEKEKIFQKITSTNLKDKYDKSEHIKLVKQRIQKRELSIRQNKCPQCGGDLIARKGKFGKFLGCNRFPKCKFTRNI